MDALKNATEDHPPDSVDISGWRAVVCHMIFGCLKRKKRRFLPFDSGQTFHLSQNIVSTPQ
jgi:hypothetical protein